MQDDRDEERLELIEGWNPITSLPRRQLRRELAKRSATIPTKSARIRSRWHLLRLLISTDPMRAAFGVLSIGPVIASVAVTIVGWPIALSPTAEYTGIVVAAGSAAAFGSIVFSVSTTLFTRAAEIAPGYTAVVLGRRSPWISGLGMIIVSGALFLLATLHPTRTGAMAAIGLAVSAVSWSWMSARRALADSDPLIMSQHAGRYYKNSVRRGTRFARLSAAAHWPRKIRADKELVDQLTRDHQRRVVGLLLRQLRAGIRSTAGQGRLTESVMLLEALVSAFADYAGRVSGEIGPPEDLLGIVLSSTDSVVLSSIQHEDNEAGAYALRQLVVVAALACSDPEYAAVRVMSARRLEGYLERTWADNKSTIPVACVAAIGDLVHAWAIMRAYEDTRRTVKALATIARRAITTRREHIGYAATEQLAKLFATLASESHPRLRSVYLKSWSTVAAPVMHDSLKGRFDGMASVTDALIPGMSSAARVSLQESLWRVPLEGTDDAAQAILAALEPHLLSFVVGGAENAEDLQSEHTLSAALTLAYGIVLFLASRCEKTSVEAQASYATVLVCRAAVPGLAGAHPSSGVAELAWSTLLAASYVGVDERTLKESAETLHAGLDIQRDWTTAPLDVGYLGAFALGLQIIAGVPVAQIQERHRHIEESLSGKHPFESYLYDWGLHIEGLGCSPSVKRADSAPEVLFKAIDAAAVRRWPMLQQGLEC